MSKNIILFYYSSMRSDVIYREFIENYGVYISHVVQMPIIPYSEKKSRKVNKELLFAAFKGLKFASFVALTVYIYTFISILCGNSLKKLCKDRGIRHSFFNRIDSELIQFLQTNKPDYIISSTTFILTKPFLDTALYGVINVHEGALPFYRGSACYFWMAINREKYGRASAILVDEGLDTGKLIYESDQISIENKSVFEIWHALNLKSRSLINQFGNDYLKNTVPTAWEQIQSDQKTYTFPKNSDLKALNEKNQEIIKLIDIYWVLNFASGKVNLKKTIKK